MFYLKLFKESSGQSLLEVVVALGVIMIVLVGLVRAGVVGVKNSTSSQAETLSARYGTEAIEWLKSEQATLGWSVFKTSFTDGATYCLSASPLLSSVSAPAFLTDLGTVNPATCAQILGTVLTRKLLVVQLVDPMTIEVQVSWSESGVQRLATYRAEFSSVINP